MTALNQIFEREILPFVFNIQAVMGGHGGSMLPSKTLGQIGPAFPGGCSSVTGGEDQAEAMTERPPPSPNEVGGNCVILYKCLHGCRQYAILHSSHM